MSSEKVSMTDKLMAVFNANKSQLAFGNYAAQFSFYVIWAIIPLLLALANVIAVLPISQYEIINSMQEILPDQVQSLVLPILEGYLQNTSTSIFSLGLIISLWPASKIFNTLQKVLNEIYDVKGRTGVVARVLAYVFTLAVMIVLASLSVTLVVGRFLVEQLQEVIQASTRIDLSFIQTLLSQGWLLTFGVVFIVLLTIYYLVPNVHWSIKYAMPGALFSSIGLALVSQLFGLYLQYAASDISSNNTIGVFIIFMIWLYFNSIIIMIGAYVNVLYHSYQTQNYWELISKKRYPKDHYTMTKEFKTYTDVIPVLSGKVHHLLESKQNVESEEGIEQ